MSKKTPGWLKPKSAALHGQVAMANEPVSFAALQVAQKQPKNETIEELERRHNLLLEEENSITSQLQSRKADIDAEKAKTATGIIDREKWAEYSRWRAKASSALRYKQEERRIISERIRAARVAVGAAPAALAAGEENNPDVLLNKLYSFTKQIVVEFDPNSITPEEKALMQAVETYLHHHGGTKR